MRVVIVAGGASVTLTDVEACRHETVIAINQSWQLAPWAAMLYAADLSWWQRNPTDFQGLRYACKNQNSAMFGATVLKSLGYLGWSDDPTAVYDGMHSGYQAIQVAANTFHATEIVLLGYDMKRGPRGERNWYPNTHSNEHFERWLDTYATLASAAKERSISILNCSRDTALTVFPRHPLREVLCDLSRSVVRA